MTFLDTLLERNQAFAAHDFPLGLKLMPREKTLIIGCVDPRVDPVDVLGVKLGEAAVIRNVGGRVVPETLQTMAMLRALGKVMGGELGSPGWHLVVLHHTDCGITRIAQSPEMLARYFGVAPGELDAQAIHDPRASVALDVARLKANPQLPGGFLVTGLVYDVATGKIETVVPPALLREEPPG
jgi:carbonic anhydrase